MGFEPTTSAVTGRRSNQLSHRANVISCTLKTAHGISLPSLTSFSLSLFSDSLLFHFSKPSVKPSTD